MKLNPFNIAAVMLLFLASCSSGSDEFRLEQAVLDLNNAEALLTQIDPAEGWIRVKEDLSYPSSVVDLRSYMFVHDDYTITFYNETTDCPYHDDEGSTALKYTRDIYGVLRFSDIIELESFEREVGEQTIYYLNLRFDQEVFVITEWSSCSNQALENIQSSDQITDLVVFAFQDPAVRMDYRRNIEGIQDHLTRI